MPALQSPFLLPWMNHLWSGLWASILYTTLLQLLLHYYTPPLPRGARADALLAYRSKVTWAVLWGIGPALLLGVAASWAVQVRRLLPAFSLCSACLQGAAA